MYKKLLLTQAFLVNSNFYCQNLPSLSHEIGSESELVQDLIKSNIKHPKVQIFSLNSINSKKKSKERRLNIGLVNDVHLIDKIDHSQDQDQNKTASFTLYYD